jgi:8-oxo-dGTP pyrophosphatase MutT (NUDIX family)/predicted GNAT family acetyltransferase
MSELHYRHAHVADVPMLSQMNFEMSQVDGIDGEAMTVEELTYRMTALLETDYSAVVMYQDDVPVGYALYTVTPQYTFIRHFFVRKAYRGQGVGAKVFQKLVENEWNNAAAIQIEVASESKGVRSFWESRGFQKTALRLSLETANKSGTRKSCGAVVYRRRLGFVQYLLVQQLNGEHWGFPKGHMDPGELEEDTARREVQEETGLRVRFKSGFYERIRYLTPKSRKKEVVCFLARAPAFHRVRVPANEIADSRWLPYEQARQTLTFENTRILLDKAEAFVRGKTVVPY